MIKKLSETSDSFKKEAGIYIFTNKKNGKVYVGETMNIKKRMKEYNYPRSPRYFESAIRKNGLEGFHLEIHYLPDFKKDDLLDLEEELIKKFNCMVPNGYNIFARGNNPLGWKHSPEARIKMTAAQMGNKKGLGTKRSAESIQKISLSKLGGLNPNAKKVNQFSQDGQFLKQWESMSSVVRELGVSENKIRRCCKEQIRQAGGFVWKYAEKNSVEN
jgi:hypothetical protein